MRVYIYRNYISDDKEALEEMIFEQIAENVKSIARVEQMTEEASDDIEEVVVNPQALFRFMREAYIFIQHIGKDNV